ncbi:protein IQ-DOMAIN 14-like [Iris pallida]|uniref:Protein IQ-DOMAIN 14-like n=1 Tax=Iris pallida TaxID=29817 RepID=A0AAX6G5Z9_IRIPA|nr:protein IQ-DOMAIN 14-like [Iris pallida]
MARKKNWFERLKRFFSSGTKSKQEKKEKRKKVWLFGRRNSRCPLPLPAPSLERSKSLKEAEEEQSKHAVAVAVATAAAAEAAVAAAQAAVKVVRLTRPPLSYPYPRAQELAAIKIQTAFRALLARRALRALKGLVKLQALIRGQAVRQQTTATLRGLQSLMKIQSQTRASRVRAAEEDWADEEKYMVYGKATGSTLQQNINRRWDSSSLSKEELIALLNNRREAALKRERALEYAFSHQERRRPMTPVSKEFEANFQERRWSWLDQWVGEQPLDKDIPEIFPSPRRDENTIDKVEETQLRYLARRSFTQSRRTSLKDDDSFSSSPSFPSYMASTASTKARFRSLSTPKQRLRTIDSCSEYCVPYTGRLLSPLPSNVSEAGLAKSSKMLKSPRLKAHGEPPPVKSDRSSKCLSFDSECSILNWDQPSGVR